MKFLLLHMEDDNAGSAELRTHVLDAVDLDEKLNELAVYRPDLLGNEWLSAQGPGALEDIPIGDAVLLCIHV